MKVEDMYFRPDPTDKKYGDAGKPFFELGIAHGKNPKDASYAYAVLPYADAEAAKAYSGTPEIEILSNTPELQVVRKKSVGVTFYVFHKAGEFEEFTVSEPCILAKTEGDGICRVSVCDPTQKLDGATVKVARKLTLTDKARQLTVECAEDTEIKVDFTHSAGEAFSCEFKN
jgi:hyaluronate lyase